MVDDSEFEAFYRSEQDQIVRALTLALGDRPLAEDCAQVGFERAYARWGRVSRHERPGAWVYVVAVRHGWRLSSRRPAPPDGQVPPLEGDDETSAVDGSLRFEELLRVLPRRQREALVLRHLADLKLADIAAAQRVTTGTVKASLHAAYERLRVHIATTEEVG